MGIVAAHRVAAGRAVVDIEVAHMAAVVGIEAARMAAGRAVVDTVAGRREPAAGTANRAVAVDTADIALIAYMAAAQVFPWLQRCRWESHRTRRI